jgi:serine/threonine protein kinase
MKMLYGILGEKYATSTFQSLQDILVQSGGPDWWVKIGDFGISKRVGEGLTALRTFSGTPGFLAPEILAQHGYLDDDDFGAGGEYTLAVDIWSLGEIAFRALTGEQPFPIKSLKAYVKGVSPFPVEVLQAHGVSKEGCDFLNSLMAPIPEGRLTARDALSHIWIKQQKSPLPTVPSKMQRHLL